MAGEEEARSRAGEMCGRGMAALQPVQSTASRAFVVLMVGAG